MIPTEKDAIIKTIEWLKNKEPLCNYCDHCQYGWQEKYKEECLKNQKKNRKRTYYMGKKNAKMAKQT